MERYFKCKINTSLPESLSLSLQPVDSADPSKDDFYSIEMEKSEGALLNFLQKAEPLFNSDTPVKYKDFTKEVFQIGTGTCYVNQKNLHDIVDLYRKNRPSGNSGVRPDFQLNQHDTHSFYATESIYLKNNIVVNRKVIEKGNRINFFYKGYIHG